MPLVESVASQTIVDWELVLVIDERAKHKLDLVEKIHSRDTRIHSLKRAPLGQSEALNLGITASRGRWIVLVEDTDRLDPCFAENMLQVAKSNNADVAVCRYQVRARTGNMVASVFPHDIVNDPFAAFSQRCQQPMASFAIDRALFDRLGGLDASLQETHAWDLWTRAARAGGKFVGVRFVLLTSLAAGRFDEAKLSRLSEEGLKVLDRIRRHDPRVVAPLEEYRSGISDDPLLAATAYLIWCCSVAAGAGLDIAAKLLRELPFADLRSQIWRVHSILEEAVLVGAVAPAGDMAEVWSRAVPYLRSLFVRIDAASDERGLAHRILYMFEMAILRSAVIGRPLVLHTAMAARADLSNPRKIVAPADVDSLHLRIFVGADLHSIVETPIYGTLTPSDIEFLATVKSQDVPKWRRLPRESSLFDRMAAGLRNHFFRTPHRRTGYLADTAVLPVSLSDRDNRKAFWESVFEHGDPWDYASGYERTKYQQTLDLIGAGQFDRVLELGCAEGHFSAVLAQKARRLIAADISEHALRRAKGRCRGLSNVDFLQIDLTVDPVPGEQNLIVCSEVLYYTKSIQELERVAEKIAAALVPGGALVMAHAKLAIEDPLHTGFKWDQKLGALSIERVFSANGGFVLDRSIQTELYRVDLWRRKEVGTSYPAPRIEHAAFTMPEARARDTIVWASQDRHSENFGNREADGIPILMYHSVSDTGSQLLSRFRVSPTQFDEQIGWLHDHGFHGVTSEEIEWHARNNVRFSGRPIMLSFDDGYADFANVAWPILSKYNFRAEVFIVLDKVGKASDWDATYGDAMPLMDWDAIADLNRKGANFGSHLASHTRTFGLTSTELRDEALRTREQIEDRIGTPILSVSYPYGIRDERALRICAQAGYRVGYSTDHGIATTAMNLMDLPRIDVPGGWRIDHFAEALGFI